MQMHHSLNNLELDQAFLWRSTACSGKRLNKDTSFSAFYLWWLSLIQISIWEVSGVGMFNFLPHCPLVKSSDLLQGLCPYPAQGHTLNYTGYMVRSLCQPVKHEEERFHSCSSVDLCSKGLSPLRMHPSSALGV